MHTVESALDLLRSVWISSYVFPVVMGLWTAFVTANIITLRSARARVVAALNNLRQELLTMRAASYDELSLAVFRFGQPILDVADELEAAGYFGTAKKFSGVILAIQNPMSQFVQQHTFGKGRGTPEEAHAVLGALVTKAMPMIYEYVPNAVRAVREYPTEWLAVLELTTLNRFVTAYGHGRQSDADTPTL